MRRNILLIGLFIAISTLFTFRYFAPILSSQFGIEYPLGLPADLFQMVGISFITFHIISYLVDIYYEEYEVEESLLRFFLYISFFPKLLQGPIERANKFLPQMSNLHNPSILLLKSGSINIVWGLFLKTVVADRLALYVDNVYSEPLNSSSAAVLLSSLIYTLQLYFDFAGYTKIAIGSSQLFGIRIRDNFNHPLEALSCTDFWRRWHISLSTFLYDYIFLPISMSLRNTGVIGIILSTIITFVLAGIWHGPTLCFLLFGLYHGTWLSIEILFNKYFKSKFQFLSQNFITSMISRRIITYIAISQSFVLFRSDTISTAKSIYSGVINSFVNIITNLPQFSLDVINTFSLALSPSYPWFTVQINTFILLFAFVIILLNRRYSIIDNVNTLSQSSQYIMAQFLVLTIISFGIVSSPAFVYLF